MGLDALQLVRREGGYGLNFIFDENSKPTKDELKPLKELDWTSVMQTTNKW